MDHARLIGFGEEITDAYPKSDRKTTLCSTEPPHVHSTWDNELELYFLMLSGEKNAAKNETRKNRGAAQIASLIYSVLLTATSLEARRQVETKASCCLIVLLLS